MQPPHLHQRINLAELKAEIAKKLGPEGSKQYFYYLSKFLGLKLCKVEFNKLCLRIVGRENLPLHNQFIHSILRNACNAKIPPPNQGKEVLKSVRAVGNEESPNYSVSSNGDIPPLSLRKVPTGVRESKLLDHKNANINVENGDLIPQDIRNPVQHHQVLKTKSENESEVSNYHHHANIPVINRLPHGSVCAQEDRREVSGRSLLQAPLGVPCCPVSVGGARKTMPLASGNFCANSFSIGGLLDTSALRERMEKIASIKGLKVVTSDSANLLNKGLDAYLKGLISSSIELAGERLGSEPTQSYTNKHPRNLGLANGVKPGHQHYIQGSNIHLGEIQEKKPLCQISLLDFKVAMELNPQQLGEDWPLVLEKICTHAFEE